jgi:hypothetical protein
MTTYRTLIGALRKLRRQSRMAPVTLGFVLDTLGETGFCLLALFLVFPFLQPFIPLGPYSTAGGLAMIGLGTQMLRGLPEPTLPERVRHVTVPPRVLEFIVRASVGFLGWLRKHTRLRHVGWVSGERGRRVAGGIILSGGLIMVIPFFGIPLNDFFPALAIVSVCVGELEQDGLMVLVALFWLAVGALYCGFLLTMIALFGWGAWNLF